MLIDGTTQPGYSGSPLIELDGSFLGPGAAGLSVTTSSSGIQGLAVNRFPGNGIELVGGGDHNVVTSNYVGVGLDGVAARGNGNGIASSSASNTIGGTAASLRNVISGNTQYGIELTGGGANTVEGNFVGTDASGNVAVPNFRGVAVNSNENTIGNASGGRNVVSGNSDAGVFVTGSDNDVTGNYIGTDADATTAVPNGFGGVYILGGATSASSNTFTRQRDLRERELRRVHLVVGAELRGQQRLRREPDRHRRDRAEAAREHRARHRHRCGQRHRKERDRRLAFVEQHHRLQLEGDLSRPEHRPQQVQRQLDPRQHLHRHRPRRRRRDAERSGRR